MCTQRKCHNAVWSKGYQCWWQAGERAERDRRRTAAAESRQARERSKRHAEERKKPVNVVMSDQQQAALEAALTADADDGAEDSWEEALEPGMLLSFSTLLGDLCLSCNQGQCATLDLLISKTWQTNLHSNPPEQQHKLV